VILVWAPKWAHRAFNDSGTICTSLDSVANKRTPSASDDIFFLSKDEVAAMPVRPMREGLFDTTLEDAFQKLLERYPEIVPGKQIRPGAEDPPRFVLLRREAPISSWSLDHLLVDQFGVLTLVECKLLENPESRREVIGQIIEYAANASAAWGGGQLRDFAHNYWSSVGKDFEEVFESTLALDIEVDEFWNLVETNLEQGKIRLLIAGDEIRPEVRRMIEYLNYEMDNVEVLGLELKRYGSDDKQLVLVPTIIGQSVASIDRRESVSRYKKWTSKDLRDAFGEMDDKDLADAYLAVLDWAEKSRTFLSSSAKNACFGIGSSSGGRILGLYHADGPWGYFESAKFSDVEDRDSFVKQLKLAGLLEESFDPDTQVQKRLNFSSMDDAEKLVGILENLNSVPADSGNVG